MSVSNRGRTSTYYGDRNKGWNFVRGAFALLALIGISFLFGFFVLARLMPDTRATNNGIPATSQNPSPSQSAPEPAVRNAVPAPQSVTQQKPTTAGPTLEPETDDAVQQPTTLDTNKPVTNPSAEGTANSSRSDLDKVTQNSTPFVPTDQMKPNDNEVQAPANPDSLRNRRRERERKRDQGETATHTDGAPASTSLFKVQVGVYSTKEAAEQEAAKVRERGFDATIHTTTESGRTLYHIQNGVYRNRANADAMRQRLQEAGIETHLAEIPSGTAGKP